MIAYATEAFFARNGADAHAEFPLSLAHVWAWFCELSAARTSNGCGLNPITFGDIEAWARLTRSEPTPWEVSLIRRVDAAILTKVNKPSGVTSNSASVTDTGAVASVFCGLKARANEFHK